MKRFFLFMALCFLSLNLLAQYGGTASVRIQNSDGEEEYINVVYQGMSLTGGSRSAVEENLELYIKHELGSGKMKSSISFNVFEIGQRTDRSGRASVKVINGNGQTRYINVSESGSHFTNNKNDLAQKLLSKIQHEMAYGERFYGSIQYSLN